MTEQSHAANLRESARNLSEGITLRYIDGLEAERDRYREALEAIAAEYEGHMGTGQMLTDFVREALA